MIVFDIDGVFIDFSAQCFIPTAEEELGREMFKLNDSWSFCERLGITKEEEQSVWNSDYLPAFMEKAEPFPHAMDLLKTSNSHAFVTSRGATEEFSSNWRKFRQATVSWIRNVLGDTQGDVHFVLPENKAETAVRLGATVMWEDHPDTALGIAQRGITVFMPLYEYNAHIIHENLFGIDGWCR